MLVVALSPDANVVIRKSSGFTRASPPMANWAAAGATVAMNTRTHARGPSRRAAVRITARLLGQRVAVDQRVSKTFATPWTTSASSPRGRLGNKRRHRPQANVQGSEAGSGEPFTVR